VRWSVLECVGVYGSVLQCAAVCCSMFALSCSEPIHFLDVATVIRVLRRLSVAVHCSVLHYVAVCCSVLQCVALRCSVLPCVCSELQ